MSTYLISFSPTGGTEKAAKALIEPFGNNETIDLCDANSCGIKEFSAQDLCIFAVPSYGGRVPALALERMAGFSGNNAKAVLLAVYGNRAYEDTLKELQDTLLRQGFCCVAGVAAIAEHSIMHQFAAGRPDASDLAELQMFGQKIQAKLQSTQSFKPLNLPGNAPYKEYKGVPFVPKAGSGCTNCGLCVQKCPAGAISPEHPKETDKQKCIACMRCVCICPNHARTLNPLLLAVASQKMKKACEGHKSNELFL